MPGADPFRVIHVSALALCLAMLPWSTALLSMAQILLVINWIAEGVVRKDMDRWKRPFWRPPSFWFIAFFLLHVIGLLWTSAEGMEWGTDLVRILLPVLVFGVILGSDRRLTPIEYRSILLTGAWSVVASTIVCMLKEGWYADYRDLSVFISHIRLAMMLCLSIVVFIHFAPGSTRRWVLHLAAIAWCVLFIDRLGSIQSFLVLLLVAITLLWRWSRSWTGSKRSIVRTASVIPLFIAIGWLSFQLKERYSFTRTTDRDLPRYSAGGEAYVHMADRQMENGGPVWSMIAWNEVERTWHLRSVEQLDSLDGRGHLLYPTLFRYLTSKGLPKDSVGIMSLSDQDVDRIEAGIPSALWGTRSRLHDRFDEVMFEIDQYLNGGRVSGHSIPMRLEFWKVGSAIAAGNLLFGVGTGDTQIAFDREYERMKTTLGMEWRHRAHNQYLTLLISFGLPGLIFSLLFLWWPAWKMKAWRNDLFVAWLIIIAIGSLTDDTIETQAGATFFAFYYAFFVLASPAPKVQQDRVVSAPIGTRNALQ